MLQRHLPSLFFALGVALFVAAGVAYYLESDQAGAYVDDVDREFPGLAVGANSISFTLHNPTRHPVRVVGAGFC